MGSCVVDMQMGSVMISWIARTVERMGVAKAAHRMIPCCAENLKSCFMGGSRCSGWVGYGWSEG